MGGGSSIPKEEEYEEEIKKLPVNTYADQLNKLKQDHGILVGQLTMQKLKQLEKSDEEGVQKHLALRRQLIFEKQEKLKQQENELRKHLEELARIEKEEEERIQKEIKDQEIADQVEKEYLENSLYANQLNQLKKDNGHLEQQLLKKNIQTKTENKIPEISVEEKLAKRRQRILEKQEKVRQEEELLFQQQEEFKQYMQQLTEKAEEEAIAENEYLEQEEQNSQINKPIEDSSNALLNNERLNETSTSMQLQSQQQVVELSSSSPISSPIEKHHFGADVILPPIHPKLKLAPLKREIDL